MILRYHSISDVSVPNCISLKTFSNQIDFIVNHYNVVKLENYNPYDSQHIVIIFDDGRRDIFNAIPILKKYNLPFYVFVVGNLIGSCNEFISIEDFAKIESCGGILGWHTKSHPDLTKILPWRINSELKNSYGFTLLSYPHYKNNKKIWKVAENLGYKFCISGNGDADTDGGNFSLDAVTMHENTNLKYINDKIVKYIDMALFSFPCNLRCKYCYVGQYASSKERATIQPCRYNPDDLYMALNKNRMGGTCIVTFSTTGETLLAKETLLYLEAILQAGHFLHISTNLTISKNIDRLLNLPQELQSRLFFKASIQYEELKRHNLLKLFSKNCNKIWDKNLTCAVELVPYDDIIPIIPEIKQWCLKNLGALPQLSMPRDETVSEIRLLSSYTINEFSKIWEDFYSEEFRFKVHMWDKKINNFCYAGKVSCFVIVNTGEMLTCPKSKVIGNFFSGDKLRTEAAAYCPQEHCFVCHNWLGFGSCPSIDETNYLLQRDRIMNDGRHWVSERCRHAFSQRVCDNNKLYSEKEEKKIYKKALKSFRKK